jgi:hypothetical protein
VTDYRVEAICRTCDTKHKAWVAGRDGNDATELLLRMAEGWKARHTEHSVILIASPANLAVIELEPVSDSQVLVVDADPELEP